MAAFAPACKDKAPAPDSSREPSQAEAPQQQSPLPAEADVRAQLLPVLAPYPGVRLGEVQLDSSPGDQDALLITARVKTIIEENLYTRDDAPEILNEDRKAANDALNRAMLPESHYLILVGAPTDLITDADRQVKPLPDSLQAAASELKQLAENPVYHLLATSGSVVEIPAAMQARRSGNHWEFSDLNFDPSPLRSLVGSLPESVLPQGAAIVREGFEQQQRAALREKIAAFVQAATPYIEGREAAARQRALEESARREEAARLADEQAATQAACHAAWEKACADFLKDGALFSGEWKRGDSFGKLSLRLARVQRYADSMQFVGVIFDPDMPQAELQVVGRCEAPPAPESSLPVTVRLYNGRYNPDVPTAEVFDAQDALLKLQLAADGSLLGIMTCEAWASSPDKAFSITLSHSVPQKSQRRR